MEGWSVTAVKGGNDKCGKGERHAVRRCGGREENARRDQNSSAKELRSAC